MIWSKAFALAALERSIKTFAQAAAALVIAQGTGLLDTDWLTVVSVSGMAALVSLLTSVSTGAVTGSPSIGGVEEPTPSGKRYAVADISRPQHDPNDEPTA